MKLTKSLLLASVAGFAAVASAQAADLPSKKAAPVEYVKVCPTYGPGFFYIPGSDVCLKIGGNVWGEINYNMPYSKADAQLGTRTNMGISLDARQSTELGLVRAFVNNQVSYRIGNEASGSARNEGLAFYSNNEVAGATKATQFNVVGMLQVGGLTVGHMDSMFRVLAPVSNIGLDSWHQPDLTNTVGYTFSLGNGLTITGALEDSTITNREGIWANTNPNPLTATSLTYGANRLPDYVGNISLAQSWGTIAASGAIHSINTSDRVIGTEYGYAAQLGTKINLPMIAAGDYLFLNGIYSSGANAFSLRNTAGDRTAQNTTGFGLGRVAVSMNDMVVNTTTGATYKAQVYGGAAEFGHYFTPTVMAHLGASYVKLDWATAAQALSTQINPASMSRVNFGVQWTPIKNLRIWPDFEYSRVNAKVASNLGNTAEGAAKKSENAFTARIQIRRDF